MEQERRGTGEPTSVDDYGDVLKHSFRLDLDAVNGEIVLLRWGTASLASQPVKEKPGETLRNARLMRYGKGLKNELHVTSFVEGVHKPAVLLRRLLQLDGSPLSARLLR